MGSEIPPNTPFTLVCEECDAGTEIGSEAEAIGLGWTEIRYAPELPMANFVGLCPDCLMEGEEREVDV